MQAAPSDSPDRSAVSRLQAAPRTLRLRHAVAAGSLPGGMTPEPITLGIIGSGPSAIYLLKHLLDQADLLKGRLQEISIFEKSQITGMGMPYNPLTTDRFNLANIASEEMPELPLSLVDWLRSLESADLQSLGLEDDDIDAGKIYPRLVLGQYLHAQYRQLVSRTRERGITVKEFTGCEILDLIDDPATEQVTAVTARQESFLFHKVIIATGHQWVGEDRPEAGYYASPWPIRKLLPAEGELHDFPIGTLGASLSAFDVINSLAHRHGRFSKGEGGLAYHALPDTGKFRIVMHAMHGWLPHLQFAQVEPLRDIYRHVDRKSLLGLVDPEGFLRIETYFDRVCRPALSEAFQQDGMAEMVRKLANPQFKLADFVETMTDKHDYADAFEGMRREMVEARKSVETHRPIHWKEVIDDLMYTLNFHAELIPAEDHLVLRSLVMPFLLNVIAAMPLESGNILLALHDAGKVELVAGKTAIAEEGDEEGLTTILVESEEGGETRTNYRMFIDCGGQKPLELPDYPFASLVTGGVARMALARFADPAEAELASDEVKEHLGRENGELVHELGGVAVDGTYRLLASDGKGNPRIHDIAFPHTSGLRPYSYGLQCCSDTAEIVIRSWIDELASGVPVEGDPVEASRIYEAI
jgi:hypothetical protein